MHPLAYYPDVGKEKPSSQEKHRGEKVIMLQSPCISRTQMCKRGTGLLLVPNHPSPPHCGQPPVPHMGLLMTLDDEMPTQVPFSDLSHISLTPLLIAYWDSKWLVLSNYILVLMYQIIYLGKLLLWITWSPAVPLGHAVV